MRNPAHEIGEAEPGSAALASHHLDLDLPSAGPEPIPFTTALAAVLGYARGRRPIRVRTPSSPEGRWVQIAAFGYSLFDAHPGTDLPLGEVDILVAEGLYGRLDRESWAEARDAIEQARPLAEQVLARAGGRTFWELPDEELSVLGEPGTVGALLRELRTSAPGLPPGFVNAALHHRRPNLFPLLSDPTVRRLGPHTREGDSGVETVVHRELRAAAEAFSALEHATGSLLDVPLTRLRLHDMLLWLSGTLRLTHAVALGEASDEWQRFRAGALE